MRVLILVEGQTEERFVKDVLARHFEPRGIYLIPTLLVTKRVKAGPNFKGGVSTFGKFENDARLLMRDTNAVVTTMIDYYGLPRDFPGMDSLPKTGAPYARVQHVEAQVKQHFGTPANFIPFFPLHEFEAWLFCDPGTMCGALARRELTAKVQQICDEFANPEYINEHPDTAPSKRILEMFPTYQKVFHGPTIAERIGLASMRTHCPHLDQWVSALEALTP